MDSPSTSESPLKKNTIQDFGESNMTESPQSKEEIDEPEEECSVCKNEIIDTTSLSDCCHEFCYDCIVGWLTKGSGPFCPMCKTPVSFIQRKGTDEKITVQQIKSEGEPAATASEDLVTEKRIVSRKIRSCRRLMNQIDEIIGATSSRSDSQKRKPRLEELNSMKQLCVSQLNSLQMLRDDIDHGAAKALIVSKAAFRRLIYERQVISEGLPDATNSLSKTEFRDNIDHYRAVLHSFLSVELKSLPAKTQPRVDNENSWYFYTLHDVAEGKDEEIINRIFSMIEDRGTRDLNAREVDAALNGLVSCRVVIAFIAELKSLINSRKSFLEWCGAITYRIRTDRGGESAGNDVVTVDDSIELEPEENRSNHRSRRFPVFTPFDRVFGSTMGHMYRGQPQVSLPPLYDLLSAPLRLGPNATNPFRPAPLPVPSQLPIAGIPWAELTTSSAGAGSARSRGSDSVVEIDDDDDNDGVDVDDDDREDSDEPRTYSNSEEDSDEEIQVVERDDTIILDDSNRSLPKPVANGSADRKRKYEFPLEDHWKKAKTSQLPEGLVDDVQELIAKYNMPLTQSMNMLVGAAQEAIIRINKPMPSTSSAPDISKFKPDDMLQLASYLSRTGALSRRQ